MRRILLALPLTLLPLAAAQAHDETAHASLGKHEHGIATLNVALDGQTLEIQLESPAMNIVGFEHAANSTADKATAAAARTRLGQPLQLFALPAAAGCSVISSELHSPLFDAAPQPQADAHTHQHTDVDADYALNCAHPEQLRDLDLSPLFSQFPATIKVNVQLIGPSGQQGAELSRDNPRLSF